MDKHQEYLMTCPSVPKLPYCPVCGKAGATTGHHVVPRGQGGHDGPVIYLCGHGTAGCHGEAEDKKLHFSYLHGPNGAAWYWLKTSQPCKISDPAEVGGWSPVVVRSEYDQSVPFDEPTEDEGDKLHELSAKLTQAAETASTLDWVVGDILNSIAPYVSTEELYDMVEEAFGIARTSTPSFISRRRKVARLDERYADLGMSKMLALLDAAEKTEYPVAHLEPELRALSTSDFRIKFGLKKEPAVKAPCPSCGKLHVCRCEGEPSAEARV